MFAAWNILLLKFQFTVYLKFSFHRMSWLLSLLWAEPGNPDTHIRVTRYVSISIDLYGVCHVYF